MQSGSMKSSFWGPLALASSISFILFSLAAFSLASLILASSRLSPPGGTP